MFSASTEESILRLFFVDNRRKNIRFFAEMFQSIAARSRWIPNYGFGEHYIFGARVDVRRFGGAGVGGRVAFRFVSAPEGVAGRQENLLRSQIVGVRLVDFVSAGTVVERDAGETGRQRSGDFGG